MATKNTCNCGDKANTTLYACSGAADLGHISDLVARQLHIKGYGQMKCLAFIGAGIENMINAVKDSNKIVIDGCPLDCGRLTMESKGLNSFMHIRITDFGFKKGETPANEQNIKEVLSKIETALL